MIGLEAGTSIRVVLACEFMIKITLNSFFIY